MPISRLLRRWIWFMGATLPLMAMTAAAQEERAPHGALQTLPAATELAWPMTDSRYADIDAERLATYVREQAAISQQDRDSGTKWWGRIAGMPSGQKEMDWAADRLKAIGLDVRTVDVPMKTQYIPKEWDVSVTGSGRTLKLGSAMPGMDFAASMPGPQGVLDLDLVWVGLGQAADFAGKDVRGKTVLIYSIPTPSSLLQSAAWMGAIERAQKGGASAVVVDIAVPGNLKNVSHFVGARLDPKLKFPIFTIGNDDGAAVQSLIDAAKGQARAHLSWDIAVLNGLTERVVVGTLPGATDEKMIMISHADSYFYGAGDDASGVATLIETAAHYARLPRAARHRTLYFLAMPDHHGGDSDGRWLHEHMGTDFAGTALILNSEHVGVAALNYDRIWGSSVPPTLSRTNGISPSWWAVNGSAKLATIVREGFAASGVPVQLDEGGSPGELQQAQWDAPSFVLQNLSVLYHTDGDTPDMVSGEGMRSAVVAYCRIFDAVNALTPAELRPVPVAGTAGQR